jgi:hypothetical protein
MDIKRLQKERFAIIWDALSYGILIEFKKDQFLFYYQNSIYETSYSKTKQKQITHKSKISLQEFFKKFNKIDNQKLKRIYADIKLYTLARKIINGGKSS